MLTNSKLKPILEEWRQARNYPGFFLDGVIGEKDWESVSPRILFLLRENHAEGWKIDGPIHIHSGNNPRFFANLARWKYLIEKVSKTSCVHDFPSDSELVAHQGGWHLFNVGYVNVKKKRGANKSIKTDIMRYAVNDQQYLKKEIDLIAPHIVICGGTLNPYRAIYDNGKNVSKISDRVYGHGRRIVLDFYHPGWWNCPGGAKGLYDRLKVALDNTASIDALTNACL